MVVRIFNPAQWAVLKPGETLVLDGENRRVVIEFNCPEPTRVDLVRSRKDLDGTFVNEGLVFLRNVEGYGKVEFYAGDGSEVVCTSDGDVFYKTVEGKELAMRFETQSFTQITQRKARNPELERMMWKMEQNITRRIESQREEWERLQAAKDAVDQPKPVEPAAASKPKGKADGGADDKAKVAGDPGGDKPEPKVASEPAKAEAGKGKKLDGA